MISHLEPRRHDIGERVLTVAARTTVEWARRTAVQMAAHPSFRSWKATHRDIAEYYPGPVDDVADLKVRA